MSDVRVLIAIPCLLLGGTEYQTLTLAKALLENGYAVRLVCYFEHDPKMVEYFHTLGVEVTLLSPQGIRPPSLLAKTVFLFKGFSHLLSTYKPTIVHVQYMAPGSLAISLFKLLGAKIVLTTAHVPGHIYRHTFVPRFIARWMSELFLCVSQSSEQAFFGKDSHLYSPELYVQGRKHFTLYNCTDLPDLLPHKVSDAPFTLGVVARLSHEKGLDILLEAMPLILQTHPTIRLLIVGEGEQRKSLEQLANTLSIDHALTWAGLQPKESLPSWYAQMDIVIVPSRFEGFGLSAIEAMSYALPVVASAVDGLKEVVDDHVTGLLVPPQNPLALSRAIITLMNNPQQQKQLGEAGRMRVKATFAYTLYQKKVAQLYGDVLKKRGK